MKITVKKAPVASGIKLEKDTLNVGETTKVVHSGTAKVNCYSANPAVVKVNKTTGEVTAVGAGKTQIAVRNAITKKRVYVDITVNDEAKVEFGAQQTGAKEITVTGSDFTADTKVTVKKGTQTVSLAKDGTTITESGTKIILTTAAKLMDGDYTVTVGDKEFTVKAQAEKVDKITVDSDVAILNVNADGTTNYREAYAYYTVSNQFGEDITKNTTVSAQGSFVASGSAIDSNKKMIRFERPATQGDAFRLGDIVTVVVMYNENGQVVSSETKQLKISDKAVVNEIEVAGLYNVDGKELTEDTLKKEDFYILFTAKDQYGNPCTDLTVGSNAESTVIATLAAGVTDVTLADRDGDTDYTVKTIKKDGKEYFGLKLYDADSRDNRKNKAGQVLLTLIGSGSGKNTAYTFEVKDGIKVQNLSISTEGKTLAASDAVATEINFTATDTYGNPVTSYKELKNVFATSPTALGEIKASTGTLWIKEDYATGNAKLMYQPASNTSGRGYTEVVNGITETYGTVISQFTVNDKAYPKSITSSPDVNALLVESANRSDNEYNKLYMRDSSFGVKDQYGRNFSVYGNGNTDADGNTYTLSVSEKSVNEQGTFGAIQNDDNGSQRYVQLASSCEAGSKTYRAAIVKNGSGFTNVKVDTYDFDFYAVHDTKIKSYEMKKVGNLYYQATETNGYAQEVVVYGKASGDVKVLMPHDYYGVTTTNKHVTIAGTGYAVAGTQALPSTVASGTAICVADDSELNKRTGDLLYSTSSVDVTVKATITSGAAIGTVLTDSIKLSKDKPQVQKDSTKLVNNLSVIYIPNNTDVTVNTLLENITVTDQYGKTTIGSSEGIVYVAQTDGRTGDALTADVKEQPKLTITGIDETGADIKVTVKNNGTFNTIVNAHSGETFKLVITYANGEQAIIPMHAR